MVYPQAWCSFDLIGIWHSLFLPHKRWSCLIKKSKTADYSKRLSLWHIQGAGPSQGQAKEGQMHEIQCCLQKGACCIRQATSLLLPSSRPQQFARVASKANKPASNAHLGIQKISAKHPKVLLCSITTCSLPLCWLIVPTYYNICFKLKLIVLCSHLIFKLVSMHPAMYF